MDYKQMYLNTKLKILIAWLILSLKKAFLVFEILTQMPLDIVRLVSYPLDNLYK